MKKPLILIFFLFWNWTAFGQETDWGVQFSNAMVDRYKPSIDVMTQKGWDHSNSIILHGMEKNYFKTEDPAWLNYISNFVDPYIAEDGSVAVPAAELDKIHPGILCLFLYEKTADVKYRKAATFMRDYLLGKADAPSVFNKTPDGGYFHKNNDHYHQVMTVDGIYMAHPFLVKYGKMFNDQECFDVAAFQTLLVAERSFNIATHLPYHAWDYSKQQSWAHKITGTSSQVWSRSVGWFAMALADILENFPPVHKDYPKILHLFQELASGIRDTQNPEIGLWHQVVNRLDASGNYPETSGSGMMIYALKKGVDKGWLDKSYEEVSSKGWNGLLRFITLNADGKPQINSFAPGMGCKDSLEEYLKVRPVNCPSEAKVQHPHGYCGVLMAASVMEN